MNTTTIALDPPHRLPGRRLAARLRAWMGHRAGTPGRRLPAGRFVLETQHTLWEVHPLGCVIACERGAVWLTFDHDPRDIVLEAGQSLRCERDAPLAIHALETSTVRVS